EQHSVRLADLLAEADPLLGRVAVEVLVVERQVADIDHRAIEIVVSKRADRARDLAIDATFAKAADDDRDTIGHGHLLEGMAAQYAASKKVSTGVGAGRFRTAGAIPSAQ